MPDYQHIIDSKLTFTSINGKSVFVEIAKRLAR